MSRPGVRGGAWSDEGDEDDEEAITDYYAVLGLHDAATPAEIKKAYRKLARQYHPDKNLRNAAQSKRVFQHITEAYDVLSDPDRRRAYDREWGPDVAWCSGDVGYSRKNDNDLGGAHHHRRTRAATAENRRSTMASAFTNAFSSRGGGNDFESAVNAWDAMMDQLLQPIKKRGAIRFQKLYRGYQVRKGLGPKFRAFLRRSRKEDRKLGVEEEQEQEQELGEDCLPIPDDASIRVGPVPGASRKGKLPPHSRRPPDTGTPTGTARPNIRLRAKTAPALKKKTRTPPITKLDQPPPVPQRNSSRLSSTRTRANFANVRITSTPPPSPPRRTKKAHTAVKLRKGSQPHHNTGNQREKPSPPPPSCPPQSPMQIAIQRAACATTIQRAFKTSLFSKKKIAVARIQALVRGANVRSALGRAYARAASAARKKFLHTLNNRVTLLQARVRGQLARDTARERKYAALRLARWAKFRTLRNIAAREAKMMQAVTLARAALQIQRAARGWRGRRVAITKKRVLRITRELAKRKRRRASAHTLQAFARLWMPRYKSRQKKIKEKKAASTLQHAVRGWILCRQAAQLRAKLNAARRTKADVTFVLSVVDLVLDYSEKRRQELLKRRWNAASNLQRFWRGREGRIAAAELSRARVCLQRKLAAVRIQSAFRAYEYRASRRKSQEAVRVNDNATRLQALVRGVLTRAALAERERATLILQCCARSRIARIRANTIRTLRWFNRRNDATFIVQRFMRVWLAQILLHRQRIRILEEKARDEQQAARRIQAWSRGWMAQRQLSRVREKKRANHWRTTIAAFCVARKMQSTIRDGRAARWQALHGSVKSSHGVLKMRGAVLAVRAGTEKIGSQKSRTGFQKSGGRVIAGPGRARNPKHMSSPNRARRVLRSSHPSRARSARSGLSQDWNKNLSIVCGGDNSTARRKERVKERLPSLEFNVNGRKRKIRSSME